MKLSRRLIITIAATATLICGIYLLLFSIGITCPIKFITGISCPGCGMTRACAAAIRLDFSAAFAYHPLWCVLPPIAALAIAAQLRGRIRMRNAFVWVMILLMLVTYAVRLANPSEVVVFEPNSSAVYRLGEWLVGLIRA